MLVTILDRAAMNAAWDSGHAGGVILRTVAVGDRCPACGGPRGVPQLQQFCEDGDWYSVDCWSNPCGHVDMYAAVLAEAAAVKGGAA